MGYRRAGFYVVGVDMASGRQYPGDEFLRKDVREVFEDDEFLKTFDAFHASPPCQLFSRLQHLMVAQGGTTGVINMIPETREALEKTGKPFVIENVPGAPLNNPVTLCGSAFGLKVRRHRLFEANFPVTGTECRHKEQGRPVGVYSSKNDDIPSGGRTARTLEEGKEAMGVDWDCSWSGLCQAIPPVYSEYLGKQMLAHIRRFQ